MKAQKIDAFAEQYSLHYAPVYNLILSKVNNTELTEDLCQEVFTRYFEKFDTIDNHRRWLFAAAKYVLLEHYKKKDANVNIDDVINEEKLSSKNDDNVSRLIIEDALENIEYFEDEKGKVLFDLIAISNYTYKETAQQLGLSERQVRYRYKIITDRIVEYFKQRGIKGVEDLLWKTQKL